MRPGMLQELRLMSAIDRRVSLDELYYRLRLRSKDGRVPLFHDGWGDHRVVDAVDLLWDAPGPPPLPEIVWHTQWVAGERAAIREGSFESLPYARYLPQESKRAHLLLVKPRKRAQNVAVLLAPTSREVDFRRRMHTALELAEQGIWTVLLDNPLMGVRKPPEQQGTVVRRFSDYPLLTATCVEENRMALAWLRAQGFERVGVMGASQGGFTGAAAALRLPFEVNVVAVAAPHSGQPVVIDGIPGRMCAWEALDRTCPGGRDSRAQMTRIFERTRLDRLPIPTPAPKITLFAARRDRYVPQVSYELLEEHWKGIVKVHWVHGGHVSTILERGHYARAIIESMNEAARTVVA